MKKVAIVGLGWLGMPLALNVDGARLAGSPAVKLRRMAWRRRGCAGSTAILLRLEPQLVCDTEDLDALMNVDALVITPAGPAYRGRGRVSSTGGAGDRRYRAGVPYSADRLHQLHLGVGNVNGTVKERIPRVCRKPPADRCSRSWRDWLCQPAGDVGGYSAPGRAGGAFPPSGTFFRRQVGAGWPARGQSGAFAGCGGRYPNCRCRPRRAGTSIIYVRPLPSGARPLLSADGPRARSAAAGEFSDSPDGGQGKIVDGNRICNELGFEYQYTRSAGDADGVIRQR